MKNHLNPANQNQAHQVGIGARMGIALAVALASVGAAAQTPDLFGDDWQPAFQVQRAGSADKSSAQWVPMATNQPKLSGAVYRWSFNPSNLPRGLTQDGVLGMITLAMGRWSQMCNVSFQYMGTTTAVPNTNDGISSIGFVSFSQIGVENASARTFPFYGGPTDWRGMPTLINDADIGINTDVAVLQWETSGLDGLFMHEIGHALGLNHSDKPAAIMSAAPYHANTYMQNLRGDDIDGCTALYGAAPNQLTNRTLNWAQDTFPNEVDYGINNPATKYASNAPATQFWQGYTYRYYPNSKTYVGTKDGRAYFMGPDGAIQDEGDLNSFTARVLAAGF